MRSLLPLLLCTGLLIGLAACSGDEEPSPEKAPRTSTEARSGTTYQTDPVPAPDTTLETLDGQTINLAEQKGKVILVNFWATWCGPCRKEIPDLIDLYSSMQEEGLMVVGVAVDDKGTDVVRPFVEKQGINYPIVVDTTRSVESHFEAMYGLPTTYVVNPEGQIVRRILGIFPTEKMKPTLKEMLGAGAA
ncbi:MAG: TlpA disulfide reductase family protein [Salinibacter sp.]